MTMYQITALLRGACDGYNKVCLTNVATGTIQKFRSDVPKHCNRIKNIISDLH